MKRILTTTCLLVMATVPIVSFVAPAVCGQEQKTATVEPSGLPAKIPVAVEWRFDQAQPDWKPALPLRKTKPAELERTTDALRVTLSESSRVSEESLAGGIYVDLPDWRGEQWAEVVVRARTASSVNSMSIGLNPREGSLPASAAQDHPLSLFVATYQRRGGVAPVLRDGLVHTYRIHLDWESDAPPAGGVRGERTGPWRRLGLQFEAAEPGSIDILSVRVVPKHAQDRVIETTLEPPQLKSDFALFRLALEEAHPALYRHTTEREMDAEFARAEATLTGPMTILQFHNVLAPVLAAIKDGHTDFTHFQGDEISAVINSAKLFPLALKFESTRGFVVLNQGLDDRVKPGMELLAINGQSLKEILQRILPNLSQDGDVRTGQMWHLGFNRGFSRFRGLSTRSFNVSYRLYIGDPASFETTLRDPRTQEINVVQLAGVPIADAADNAEKNPVNRAVLAGISALRALGRQQTIRYLDGEDTAILIPGFQPRETFPGFLEKAFAQLRSKGTKNLIVDMRGNGGGFDVYPGLLFSYLTSKEFRTNEPSYMKTFQPSFRQYTDLRDIDPVTDTYFGSAAGIWKPGPNGGWLMTEKYPMVGERKPSENHFDGTVYVLMDGGSFSAASAFCATTDFYKRAIFIGEETGGVGGGAGGADIGPTLPESHLHVNIPMEAEFGVADKSNRRGTLPAHAVTQTVDDFAKGRDTVLEFTRELIRSGRER